MRIYRHILTKYIFFFSLLVFVDQISKYLIRHFGGFYVCNLGISWGVCLPDYIFWLFWISIMVFLAYFLVKRIKTQKAISINQDSIFIIFIVSGAFSNVVDRLKFGCVIDFIDFEFWPVFNLADVFIVLGAVFLLVRWRKL